MKFAVIALLGLTQSIVLDKKAAPEKEAGEKPVWREFQPDLFTDKDSVNEGDEHTLFHELETSEKFVNQNIFTLVEFYHPDEVNSKKYYELYEKVADYGK